MLHNMASFQSLKVMVKEKKWYETVHTRVYIIMIYSLQRTYTPNQANTRENDRSIEMW